MCLTIKYHCPYCRSPSSHTSVKSCGHEVCVGMVERQRYMDPQHFHGWYCNNDLCVYSMSNRAMARFEVKAIRRAQANGQILPEDLMDDSHDDDNNMNATSVGDTDMDATSGERAHGNQAENAAEAYAWFREQVAEPTEPLLPKFQPNAVERILVLLEKIAILAADKPSGSSKNPWFAQEDELLQLLRNNVVQYRVIAKFFLRRHSWTSCETRHSCLTKADKPERPQRAAAQTSTTAAQAQTQQQPQQQDGAAHQNGRVAGEVEDNAGENGMVEDDDIVDDMEDEDSEMADDSEL
ncbi:hypothetical protein VTK26DRAFT_7570 [Humicola hyalothermophila]